MFISEVLLIGICSNKMIYIFFSTFHFSGSFTLRARERERGGGFLKTQWTGILENTKNIKINKRKIMFGNNFSWKKRRKTSKIANINYNFQWWMLQFYSVWTTCRQKARECFAAFRESYKHRKREHKEQKKIFNYTRLEDIFWWFSTAKMEA